MTTARVTFDATASALATYERAFSEHWHNPQAAPAGIPALTSTLAFEIACSTYYAERDEIQEPESDDA